MKAFIRFLKGTLKVVRSKLEKEKDRQEMSRRVGWFLLAYDQCIQRNVFFTESQEAEKRWRQTTASSGKAFIALLYGKI